MKTLGIHINIQNRSATERTGILSSMSFDIAASGFGITTNPVDSANYFYRSETNNGHGKELDSLAEEMMATEDPKKQIEKANELEKRHLAEVAIYVPTNNGPDYVACKKGLANYGPRLFAAQWLDASTWFNVGWEK